MKSGLQVKVHQPPVNEITAVQVCLPGDQNLSSEVIKLIELGLVQFSWSDRYQLELEFDHGKQDKVHRFEPTLPIVVKW
ncbi:hypothetical protein [Fischerella sp. JS2]|uniref:hypothetical protein n=1 Tax=Fischerella sp. JS2 TaxID=2597771 RepID=UPI0028E51F71|nr:hypothetical protein [Fischerella sp. JS2]